MSSDLVERARYLVKHGALKPNVQLQPHQAEAVARAANTPGQLLNWGLGSGKTLGAIAVAEKKGGNVLVVTPASLRENFRQQLKKFVTADRVFAYTVISYDEFRRDPEGWISRVRPNVVIADEYHRLRNDTPREPFERVRARVPFLLGLTGSLINNHPTEIVPLVNLVADKPVFKSIRDFENAHIDKQKTPVSLLARLRGVKPGTVEKIKKPGELKEKLAPFVHRFTGTPEFKRHVPKVQEEVVEVQMTPRQEQVYRGLQTMNPILAYKIRHNLPPTKRELKDMNAFLVAARQVSNNPADFDKTLQGIEHSAKLSKQVDELVAAAKRDKNFRAVVYSSFLSSGVDPVVNELQRRGVSAASFTGKLNDEQRKKIVDDLNNGRVQILGLSPAGGEGLDLKGVRVVQLTDDHWNPERTSQAVGRAARFMSHAHLAKGQRNVRVRRFVAVPRDRWYHTFTGKPTSADQWIAARRAEKQKVNQQFLNALA